MAVLDRDGMYGAPRFYMAAKKINIRALIGAEITSEEGWRYPLLVESRRGYQNVCRLITRMKLRARKGEGQISRAEMDAQLESEAGGLICLTGGDEGPLAHALASGGMPAAIAVRAAACANCLASTTCMSNCSAIFAAKKKFATSVRWRSREN